MIGDGIQDDTEFVKNCFWQGIIPPMGIWKRVDKMERTTVEWLSIFLADEFHDWIDGDDPVSEYTRWRGENNYYVWVKFESGAQFKVTIEEVFE